MKTSNFNNSESMNGESQAINYTFEIVRDFDGTYYANVHNELDEHFRGLPEYVTYKELNKAVKEALGVTLPALIDLHFEKSGRKRYAQVYDLKGVRVEQPAMAFGLQDKVVLGAFGERRYAIGCIVTGYRWDSEAVEFLYILQGEDGKEYADFERNIIADKGEEPTLEPASEITEQREQNDACISSAESRRDKANGQIRDIPAADLCWDEDEQGVKVWGNIDKHAESLTRMGAKRGRLVFKSNKTGLPTGADCYVLSKSKCEDVRQYVRKVHERISRDFSEAREKFGDKGHKYHEGERVVTIYGRGTVIKTDCWYASDLIDVQLDLPTYNYIWSLLGTPQRRVAVSRDNIVSIELPEPPKEIIIEDATLQNSGEIKPKAAFQIGDRVERKSDGERGTVDGYDVTDGKLTYIVKYDRTQRRESDGFEYLSEELNGDELQTNAIGSRKRTIIARAKEDKQAWRLVKGCEVRVRKAYTNESSDPKDWTYCVSWYADGQLVECENGVRLEQAAKALNDLPQWAEARKAA